VIAAVKELGVPVPIVIRMEGTNVEEGKRLLKESGLNFATADSMGEAADTVVALAKRAHPEVGSSKSTVESKGSKV
jgi:succinyl-CoA synthetase beta subunit